MNPADETEDLQQWRAAVRATLATLPAEYKDASPKAVAFRKIFYEEYSKAIQPRLNNHLKSIKHETYTEKRDLSSWVNHELHYVHGLTIHCPRTDRPALLIADFRDADSEAGRFRYDVHGDDGGKMRTYTSSKLPELELMGDPPRTEGFSRLAKRGKDSKTAR